MNFRLKICYLRQEVDHLKENHSNDSEQSHQGRVNSKPDNNHSQEAFAIGDSMLRDFNSKNFINTQFKSISGATVSNVFDHLNSRKDLHIYKDIVIHAGTNDVAKNIALDKTLLAMEASITWLMRKAPTARVHVSAVCPRTKDQLQHKIDTLNAAFKELATRLDCNFIESGQQMVYQNGRVDATQFSNGLHLSKHGLETLTTVLVESVPTAQRSDNNWTEVTRGKKNQNVDQTQRPETNRIVNLCKILVNRTIDTRKRVLMIQVRELLNQKQNGPTIILQDVMIDNITGIIRTQKRRISITPATPDAGSADFTIITQIRVITIQNYSAANVMNMDTKQSIVTLSITEMLATICVPMNTMIKFLRVMEGKTMN